MPGRFCLCARAVVVGHDDVIGHVKSPARFRHKSAIMSSTVDYPVVIAKHPETGRILCLALFGLESGEDLFSNNDGWRAPRIAMNITDTPFAMVESAKRRRRHVDLY